MKKKFIIPIVAVCLVLAICAGLFTILNPGNPTPTEPTNPSNPTAPTNPSNPTAPNGSQPTKPTHNIPMFAVPENPNPDTKVKVSGRWTLNEDLTCLEFIDTPSFFYADCMTMQISMTFVEDEENPVFELYYGKTLICTRSETATNWENGSYRTINFGENEKTVTWEFYCWLQANAKKAN